VGEDFEKRIIDGSRDTLLLVYHPLAHKNRGLKEKFEQFAEQADDSKLLVGRYNGVNESKVFRSPSKLPALLLFKQGTTSADESSEELAEFKEQVEY